MPNANYIQNILFCDEVRTEQSGKDIAIGIYNGNIIVPKFPWILTNFAIRLELFFGGEKVDSIDFMIKDPLDNCVVQHKVPIVFFDYERSGNLTLNLSGLILVMPGEYKIMTCLHEKWEVQRVLTAEKFDPATMQARMSWLKNRTAESADLARVPTV